MTFALVARLSTIQNVIALAAEFEMILNQYDVTAAYLNGRFKEAVFMKSLNGRTLERIVNTELKASEVRKKVMKMLTEFRKGNSLFIKEDFL